MYAIVGPVGSSKTTLLQTILGELDLDDGFLTVNGSVSYASQEPWIFEGTIKQNILFTETYDEDRWAFEIIIGYHRLARALFEIKLYVLGVFALKVQRGSASVFART